MLKLYLIFNDNLLNPKVKIAFDNRIFANFNLLVINNEKFI